MSVETVTLGCRLNFAESEALAALAPAGETWTIVNSCAVTGEAVRRSRQAVRRAHRERPDAHILATGCAVALDPEAFRAMAGVSRVVGNAGKLGAFRGDGVPADVMPPPIPAGFQGKVRSFVAVQTGCDHRCTFCTIWTARGPSRTLPYAGVRDAIARELERGASEIVLTGVDITAVDGGLGRLCQRLLADLPRLDRLRLSSLDSVEIDEALLELIAGEHRLMPHFHLSLQSGDDMILKRMKRRHSRSEAVAMIARIKSLRPAATIGADLIAGFPTEDEQMHRNNLELLDDCDIIAAHVFPFSARPGTPAARMPQLSHDVVKARAAELRAAAARRRNGWLDGQIGSVQPVLIENGGKGHSDTFAPVAIPGARRGESGLMRITGRDGDALTGHWA